MSRQCPRVGVCQRVAYMRSDWTTGGLIGTSELSGQELLRGPGSEALGTTGRITKIPRECGIRGDVGRVNLGGAMAAELSRTFYPYLRGVVSFHLGEVPFVTVLHRHHWVL